MATGVGQAACPKATAAEPGQAGAARQPLHAVPCPSCLASSKPKPHAHQFETRLPLQPLPHLSPCIVPRGGLWHKGPVVLLANHQNQPNTSKLMCPEQNPCPSRSPGPLLPQVPHPGTCLLTSRWKASLAPPSSPASNSPESPGGSISKMATSSAQPPRLGPLLPSDCALPDRDPCVPLTSSSGCLQWGQAPLLKPGPGPAVPCSAPAHAAPCTVGCRPRHGAARAFWPVPHGTLLPSSAARLFWGLVPLTC